MFSGLLKKILHKDDLNFGHILFYDYVSISTVKKLFSRVNVVNAYNCTF